MQTFLYVPANKNELFKKASALNTRLIFDLEDAVDEGLKEEARLNLLNYSKTSKDFYIRINAKNSAFFEDDIKLLEKIGKIAGVFCTKCETSLDFAPLKRLDLPIIAMIESAKGVQKLDEIAAFKGLFALSFGPLDLAFDFGLKPGEGLDFFIKSLCVSLVLSSKRAGLKAPIYGVYPDFKDEQGFKKTLSFASSMGFKSIQCIHPNQLKIAKSQQSEDELKKAKDILKLSKQSKLFQYQGKMVDAPVIKAAKKLIEDFEGKKDL